MTSPQQTCLPVRDIIGSPFAVSADDGQLVYDATLRELRAGRSVCLSFSGITSAIGAFLNAAVGQLVPEFTEADLDTMLTVSDMESDHETMFHAALRNARAYCTNPEAYQAAWAEVMGSAV